MVFAAAQGDGRAAGSGDVLGAVGEQAEVPHVVAVGPQPTHHLLEVAGIDQRHRHDRGPVPLARDQVQHLIYALPPGREVLEIRP